MTRIALPSDISDETQVRAFYNTVSSRLGNITTKNLLQAPSYSDADRPNNLTVVDKGIIIFNTDDLAINVWNGNNWTDANGIIT